MKNGFDHDAAEKEGVDHDVVWQSDDAFSVGLAVAEGAVECEQRVALELGHSVHDSPHPVALDFGVSKHHRSHPVREPVFPVADEAEFVVLVDTWDQNERERERWGNGEGGTIARIENRDPVRECGVLTRIQRTCHR